MSTGVIFRFLGLFLLSICCQSRSIYNRNTEQGQEVGKENVLRPLDTLGEGNILRSLDTLGKGNISRSLNKGNIFTSIDMSNILSDIENIDINDSHTDNDMQINEYNHWVQDI